MKKRFGGWCLVVTLGVVLVLLLILRPGPADDKPVGEVNQRAVQVKHVPVPVPADGIGGIKQTPEAAAIREKLQLVEGQKKEAGRLYTAALDQGFGLRQQVMEKRECKILMDEIRSIRSRLDEETERDPEVIRSRVVLANCENERARAIRVLSSLIDSNRDSKVEFEKSGGRRMQECTDRMSADVSRILAAHGKKTGQKLTEAEKQEIAPVMERFSRDIGELRKRLDEENAVMAEAASAYTAKYDSLYRDVSAAESRTRAAASAVAAARDHARAADPRLAALNAEISRKTVELQIAAEKDAGVLAAFSNAERISTRYAELEEKSIELEAELGRVATAR